MSRHTGRRRARTALGAALAGALLLPACSSSGSAPATHRDLVVARAVSVSPTLPQRAPRETRPENRAGSQAAANASEQATASRAPARRPGAMVKAPRPGDDLSKAPAPTRRPPSEASTRAESTIKVAGAESARSTAPQPTPQPKPAPEPKPASATASSNWWTSAPSEIPGRIRIVASGVGENLREARQAAVETGLAQLRARLGADPEGVTYERTTVRSEGSGRLRGFVLVSCDKP